ncbi:hypothetical protein AVEN_269427-1 [Araneus ventricosus]|uniref:Uncharacterized protein n=1 Tax=Araneus ventricosus TaxID=182803 RepID=A0A4Y2XAX1_ARAVE|nr:hypothetical protein AVEN_269427-1 [Araneus ventricosus]
MNSTQTSTSFLRLHPPSFLWRWKVSFTRSAFNFASSYSHHPNELKHHSRFFPDFLPDPLFSPSNRVPCLPRLDGGGKIITSKVWTVHKTITIEESTPDALVHTKMKETSGRTLLYHSIRISYTRSRKNSTAKIDSVPIRAIINIFSYDRSNRNRRRPQATPFAKTLSMLPLPHYPCCNSFSAEIEFSNIPKPFPQQFFILIYICIYIYIYNI